jgi:hypothetical protein
MGHLQPACMVTMIITRTVVLLTATMGLAGFRAESSLAQVPGSVADITGVAASQVGAAS